jgi:multicomponent Na+:H+ antiporter subunit E
MNSRVTILKAVALFGVWLLLAQTFDPFYVGLGLVASIAVARLNSGHARPSGAKIHWVQAALYVPWLFWKVLQSGLHLSYLILHPRLPIDPQLIRYHTKLCKPLGIVTLGNSVTLTPGTITAEVNSNEIVVHAIDPAAADDLTSLRFERRLARVFEVKP